jgi:hypothetical protein
MSLKTLSQINIGDAWIELRRLDQHPEYIRTSAIVSVSFDDSLVKTARVCCGDSSFTISANQAADLMRLVSSQTSSSSSSLLDSKGNAVPARSVEHGQKWYRPLLRLFGKRISAGLPQLPQLSKSPPILTRPLSFQCAES